MRRSSRALWQPVATLFRMTKTLLAAVGALLLLASCGQAKRDLTLTYFNLDG